MSEKTIFARIVDREIPAKIVYEDDRVLAFHDVNPQAPIHILVIPKKPIDRIDNMTPEDRELVGHIIYAATQIARQQQLTDGYRLVINNGEHAGQTVFHIHCHILGGRRMGWPPG
jgi:histidine triad (HIT) family protein